ncbi:MAG TPA: polyprenol monophosphomannose synthase [Gemmataceae bacterium]|jgi:dolichol-phosphate mannosyltransferase|nr:polyprenol monophosphomannose synthase [Gemmataceae bacterium]
MPTGSEPRVLVALATYNERDNLRPLVQEIRQTLPSADVLILDDNSPDGTGALADELAAADPRIHVIHRPGKLGLGTATVAIMRYAMEHDYDFLINMDADFSHSPRYLPALLAGMNHYDVMIGSRYVQGGSTVNWPLSRRLMSRCVNILVRLLMRIPAQDTSGAFRCYRVAKLRQTDLRRLRSRGYSFQQEVLYRCRKAGCRIGETPIVFENRRAGASKVNPREAVRSLAVLVWVGLGALFGHD